MSHFEERRPSTDEMEVDCHSIRNTRIWEFAGTERINFSRVPISRCIGCEYLFYRQCQTRLLLTALLFHGIGEKFGDLLPALVTQIERGDVVFSDDVASVRYGHAL